MDLIYISRSGSSWTLRAEASESSYQTLTAAMSDAMARAHLLKSRGEQVQVLTESGGGWYVAYTSEDLNGEGPRLAR
jgi:hypothetical protein